MVFDEAWLQYCFMRLDPRRLAVLLAVQNAGGLTAAAATLHLTPSAVSQQLAALERETGATLVDRSRGGGRRPLTLTAVGRRLAEHAATVADALAAAEQELATMTGRASGVVRVSAFATVVEQLLGPAVALMAEDEADVCVRVLDLDEDAGLQAVHSGAIDIALVESHGAQFARHERGLSYAWLLDDPYLVAAPSAWGALELDQLLGRFWVQGPEGSAARRALDLLAESTGAVLKREHEVLRYPAALALVAAGLGAAVVPAMAVTDPLTDGVRLVETPHAGARSIGVVHRVHRYGPSPAVLSLLEALRRVAEGTSHPLR
jgi:DNA-binding transcriptional LysR family regulator